MKKDTVYVDADDEISVIVDKVKASKAKVVALVLPKRCNVLHSAVNMKILNKAATTAKKSIVLITSEKAIMSIAGSSGVYVASTLSSKPAVPAVAAAAGLAAAHEVSANLDGDEPAIDETKSIGELDGDTPIELTDTDVTDDKEDTKTTTKKDKKLAVPNFESFRTRLFIGIGLLLLFFVLWYVAAFVLPRATITIEAEQRDIPVAVGITASSDYTDDIEKKTFKLETKTIDKSASKEAPATGEKNVGKKATGTVSFYNCSIDDKLNDTVRTVPAGTGVSSGSKTFITQAAVSVKPSGFNNNVCKKDQPTAEIAVVAQESGGDYNLSARNYSVSGVSTMTAVDSSGMGGGTDETVKIVAASDCDALEAILLAESNSDEVKAQLKTELEAEGMFASLDTYKSEVTSSSCLPAVGEESETVTAKASYKYTLSGVNSDSLTQLVTDEALKEAGEEQTIIDTGMSTASLTVDQNNGDELEMTIKTVAVTGVKQDKDAIANMVAGKNARETADTIREINGVKDVTVDYSPLWVRKTPTKTEHITIEFTSSSDGN